MAQSLAFLLLIFWTLGTLSNYEWGFTGILPRRMVASSQNTFLSLKSDLGSSRHLYSVTAHSRCEICWEFPIQDLSAAPSHLLTTWNKRETELVGTNPNRVPPLALLPTTNDAILGSLKGAEFWRLLKRRAGQFLLANTVVTAILKPV